MCHQEQAIKADLVLRSEQGSDDIIDVSYSITNNVCHREDLDKAKKDQKKQKDEYEAKIKTLNEKINNLQTSLENTKTELAHQHKVKTGLTNDIEVMQKEIETLKRKVNQREESLEDNFKIINDLKESLRKKDLEFNQTKWEM